MKNTQKEPTWKDILISIFMIAQFTQENGKIVKNMALENKSLKMAHFMKDFGKQEKLMDLEDFYMLMETITLENLKMIKHQVKVNM